jgi:hypothetical protein
MNRVKMSAPTLAPDVVHVRCPVWLGPLNFDSKELSGSDFEFSATLANEPQKQSYVQRQNKIVSSHFFDGGN